MFKQSCDFDLAMEVYKAMYDYEKEREDILSFKEGDLFRIASKADKRWWAAYAVTSGDYGYVPSQYLEVRNDTSIRATFLHVNSQILIYPSDLPPTTISPNGV